MVNRPLTMVERTKGRRPQNRPSDTGGCLRTPGLATQREREPTATEKRNSRNSVGGISAQNPVYEGEGTQGPQRRGATGCCRLSRQLLVRLSPSSYSGLCLRSGLLVFCGLSLEGRSAEEDRPANLRPRPLFVVSAHTDRLHDFLEDLRAACSRRPTQWIELKEARATRLHRNLLLLVGRVRCNKVELSRGLSQRRIVWTKRQGVASEGKTGDVVP